MMKKLLFILGLAMCGLVSAQSIDVFFELTLAGDAGWAAKPMRFGVQSDCDAAVKNYGNLPEVKAKGDNAVFDCPRRIRFVPSVTPPAPDTQVTPPIVADFVLSTTRTIDAVPTLAKPVKGLRFTEPTYKTDLRRVSNHSADGVPGFAITDYSRRQAFNADSSKFLIYGNDGSWHVYDATTFARIKQLSGPSGDAEPQWNSTDPDKLYYVGTNGQGMKLSELTVSANTSRVVADFSARLRAKWPAANAAWTKSEGSPSKDGRFWCFMVDDASWRSVGVFTWDRDTDTIIGARSTNGVRPDHVSMSPSGSHCVVSGVDASGTVAWTRDFSSSRKVHTTSEHSDLAIDANGDDVYVSIDYQSAKGDLFMVNLRTGERTALLSTYAPSSATAMHISGKGFNKPGWVVVSTYAGQGMQWFFDKVMAVQLKASPTIYNLAFHRAVEAGYYTEPHATVNRDFTKILFNSNWGVNSDTDLDAYQIELPVGSVK